MTKSVFFEIVVSEHRNYATIKYTGDRVEFPRKLEFREAWYLEEWFKNEITTPCRLYLNDDMTTFWIQVATQAFFCPALLQKRFADLCAAESALFDHINFLFTPKF